MKKRNKIPFFTYDQVVGIFGDVHKFSDIHWRIRGILDIWPTTGKYWSPTCGIKGSALTTVQLFEAVEQADRYS